MLLKCPECSHEVSSQAASCPKCGHPLGASHTARNRKKSHSGGWLSLAAFVLSNFTPAILVPLLVLAGLVFAARELRVGSRVFGVIVVCLSLLQGWMVLDHFGNISGSLGLVTAEDTDAKGRCPICQRKPWPAGQLEGRGPGQVSCGVALGFQNAEALR